MEVTSFDRNLGYILDYLIKYKQDLGRTIFSLPLIKKDAIVYIRYSMKVESFEPCYCTYIIKIISVSSGFYPTLGGKILAGKYLPITSDLGSGDDCIVTITNIVELKPWSVDDAPLYVNWLYQTEEYKHIAYGV